MNVYTDESGDLGWTLDKIYRSGGSSQFLTIAHAIVPKAKKFIPKRIVRDLYDYMKWPTGKELKASDLKPKHRIWFASKSAAMLSSNKDIKVVVITVKKVNVMVRFRHDPNKLYNYMMRLALLDQIKQYPLVTLFTDQRSIKVQSGNSLCDYLQTMLWTDLDSDTVLKHIPVDSKGSVNVQFADFMANFVWRSHEIRDIAHMAPLRGKIIQKTLFF